MSDPALGDVIDLIQAIRRRVGKSQRDVANCMGIDANTYRHIEKRRRPLPDFQHGLIAWIRRLLRCLGATAEEEQEALRRVSHAFLGQFSTWLEELRQHEEEEGEAQDAQGG